MLIGLTGYAGAGKDTVGQILVDHHGFRRVAFADRLKRLALDLNPRLHVSTGDVEPVWSYPTLAEIVECYGDLEVAKREVPAVRGYLQDLGVKVRLHVGETTWVDAAMRDCTPGDSVVVTDVRFRNEAEAIRSAKGLLVRVERPGFGPVNGHVSERDMAEYPVDVTLVNGGTLLDLEASLAAALGYVGVA